MQSDEDTIAKSLRGDYRAEHLFALRQALELYDTYHVKIDECDHQIEQQLQRVHAHANFDPALAPASRPRRKGEPHGDFRSGLYRVSGVDLTQIDGIKINTVLVVLSEIGPDLSRFPTEKRFCSWLGLCPNPQISGGRNHGDRSRRVVNRAAQALRIAAQALRNSRSALGAYFRRLLPRLGAAKTIKAVAHKLARLVYRLLTGSTPYVDPGSAAYEARFRSQQVRTLTRRATALGLRLIDPLVDGPQGDVS